MKFYHDDTNCIWLPDNRNYEFDFLNYQKERKILRTLVYICIDAYDPFILLSSFCASEYAHKICQGNHSGYFFGEGRFINDLKNMNALVSRKFDWDIIIFHWIIDLYLAARYDLGMEYNEIACKYPVESVYTKFNPLHETSELNALSKMQLEDKPLAGCVINDKYYLFVDQVPSDKKYLLDMKDSAESLQTYFCCNAYFFDNLEDICLSNSLINEQHSFEELKQCILKFCTKEAKLKNKLQSSSGKFVYCKDDSLYGIGLPLTDYRRLNVRQWKGQNLLGYALQEVYNELKGE